MLFGFGFCISALAQTPVAQAPVAPRSGFYVGLGGSYNSMDFGTQDVFAKGTSQTFQNGMLTSTGVAAGPGTVDMPTEFRPGTFGISRTALGYGERDSRTAT
jgi:hypothetical protein